MFPNLLFAKDGDVFTIEGLSHMVIGGAYSVDKYYRLAQGLGWWDDEQPSKEIKEYVECQVRKNRNVDVVLSHTCPFNYRPVEAFLPMIDQTSVDDSTERWLDTIELMLDYHVWMCGHWHINKKIDKLQVLYHDFVASSQFTWRNQNEK
jgi:3-oxoacid CoA-transferase subunit A